MPTTHMTHLDNAKQDPSSEFQSPNDVIRDRNLSREEKIDILSRWAYEEREKAVAEEENMLSYINEKNILDEILRSLLSLNADSDQKRPPPTKQG